MGRIEALIAAVTLLMRLRGFNQADLAERSGISKSQLSRYLSNKSVPQLHQIFRLIDALEVPDLFFWWTVSQVREVERMLASDLDEESLLRSVLGSVLGGLPPGAGEAAGSPYHRLLEAARHSHATSRSLLDVLAGEPAPRGEE